MRNGYRMVRDAVKQCPLPLLYIKEKNLLKCAEDMLPYSVGIEIECRMKNSFSENLCKQCIPELISIDCDLSELRFRIPNGIKGMIALYKLSDFLKEHAELNLESGIHYHIDFTDIKKENFDLLRRIHSGSHSFILKSLKSWDYKGNFNTWEVSNRKTAVKFHSGYKTLEFRIGEMTFDYELLMKRIINCQNISRALKSSLKRSHLKKGETKVAGPRVIGRIQL